MLVVLLVEDSEGLVGLIEVDSKMLVVFIVEDSERLNGLNGVPGVDVGPPVGLVGEDDELMDDVGVPDGLVDEDGGLVVVPKGDVGLPDGLAGLEDGLVGMAVGDWVAWVEQPRRLRKIEEL